VEFAERTRIREAPTPLDPVIHVCEYVGFLDEDERVVGCMLHPSARGNGGVDLRGLCHYGSMACKTFHCPAWDKLESRRWAILVRAIDDWHLYGLVITDVEFVLALFALLEARLGEKIVPERLFASPALGVFKEMIGWKSDGPFAGSSTLRRSRYHVKPQVPVPGLLEQEPAARIASILAFTYGLPDPPAEAAERISAHASNFSELYR
jgi:hypothetical protein